MTTLQKFIQDTINSKELDDIEINEKHLKEQLKEFDKIILSKKPEKVLFLDGPWGIGKSYYVKNILETKLKLDKKYTPIRVSLFGLRSIDELKDKLLNEYIKERNEKILKWFNGWIGFIFLLFFSAYIAVSYWMNSFCKISSLEYSYIFKIFTNQCNNNTPNYIKVVGDTLKYLHFIPEIYLWLYFLSKFPMTKHFTDYIDHKYFGTSLALQKTEMKRLFPPERNILIFDDIERTSNINLEELFGFLNDLRENKGFSVIVIGDEIKLKDNKNFNIIVDGDKLRLKGKDNYIDNLEKIEFQKIHFEYTKKRYENLKKYCLKSKNITGENIKKLSDKINDYIDFCYGLYNSYNLRVIKKIIMTVINITTIINKKNIKNEDTVDNFIKELLRIYIGKEISGNYMRSHISIISDKEFYEITEILPEIIEENIEKILKRLG